MLEYARAGFDTFDMADHYGSAELIAGRFLGSRRGGRSAGATARSLHQMVPGARPDDARSRARRRRAQPRRLGVATIDLLQFHWWSFEHPAYLDAMKELDELRREGLIRHLGVTNFDTAHLRVAGEARHRDRLEPGLLFASRPPGGGRDERVLPRTRHAPARLRHACRQAFFRAMAWAAGAGGRRDQRLEQDEVQALRRRRRRLAGLAGDSLGARRVARARASRSPTSRRAGCSNSRRSPP